MARPPPSASTSQRARRAPARAGDRGRADRRSDRRSRPARARAPRPRCRRRRGSRARPAGGRLAVAGGAGRLDAEIESTPLVGGREDAADHHLVRRLVAHAVDHAERRRSSTRGRRRDHRRPGRIRRSAGGLSAARSASARALPRRSNAARASPSTSARSTLVSWPRADRGDRGRRRSPRRRAARDRGAARRSQPLPGAPVRRRKDRARRARRLDLMEELHDRTLSLAARGKGPLRARGPHGSSL